MTARERCLAMMQELGIEPKKSLGQNFLVSDHVINKIISAVEDFHPQSLIEIGPGLGALTEGLLATRCALKVIELDERFANYWRERGLQVLEEDALQLSWSKVMTGKRPQILVSNLPYQISSSLVIDRSLDTTPLDGMILMFQKEVAQKIRARHGDSGYGMLSVVAQTFWQMDLLLEAGPRDFLPPPQVASRVLLFKPRQAPVQDRSQFLRFVKACFLHPRKLMASNIVEGLGQNKETLLAKLQGMGLKEKVRAQELTLQQFLDLFKALGYK